MPRKLTMREKAFEAEKAKMANRFAAEYRNLELHSDELEDNGLVLKRLSIDEYVENKLETWESRYYVEPIGRYEDPNITRLEFQRQFVVHLHGEYPVAFEHLKQLSSGYVSVFGGHERAYEPLFHFETLEAIENWAWSFANLISYPLLDYRINIVIEELEHTNFRYDFRLRSFLTCLLIAKAIHDPEDIEVEYRGKKAIANSLVAYGVDNLNSQYLSDHPDQIAEYLVRQHRLENDDKSLKSKWDDLAYASKLLNPADPPSSSTLASFLIDLIDWAERFNLGKTWLVRYGLHYLGMHVTGKLIDGEHVEFPRLISMLPIGFPVKFEFRGWNTYEESKQDYEKQLRKEFEKYLATYFKETYFSLDLKGRKRVTKPVEYDRVKWVVLSNIAEKSLDEIHQSITNDENDEHNKYLNDGSIIQAIGDMCRHYDLPTKRPS